MKMRLKPLLHRCQTIRPRDTESVPGVRVRRSPGSGVEPEVRFQRENNFQAAFLSLDDINIKEMFETRAQVMRTVPFFMRGALRGGFRVAIDEVVAGRESGDRNREERGWKLFFLVPRMLLHRPRRGGLIPRKKLQERVDKFSRGSWVELARDGWAAAEPKQLQCTGTEEVTEMQTTEQHGQRSWQWLAS